MITLTGIICKVHSFSSYLAHSCMLPGGWWHYIGRWSAHYGGVCPRGHQWSPDVPQIRLSLMSTASRHRLDTCLGFIAYSTPLNNNIGLNQYRVELYNYIMSQPQEFSDFAQYKEYCYKQTPCSFKHNLKTQNVWSVQHVQLCRQLVIVVLISLFTICPRCGRLGQYITYLGSLYADWRYSR